MNQEKEQSLEDSALSPEGQVAEDVVTEQHPAASEAASENPLPPDFWETYDKYYQMLNGLLASRENLKLVAIDKNLKRQYYRKWSQEADSFFSLLVGLKRRRIAIKKLEKASPK